MRVLAYTSVRMHYGHPDLFDGTHSLESQQAFATHSLSLVCLASGYWCRFHVGLSKASVESNLSEDLLFGYDSISRYVLVVALVLDLAYIHDLWCEVEAIVLLWSTLALKRDVRLVCKRPLSLRTSLHVVLR